MKTKRIYGLIGYPLTHSFSPGYFNNKFALGGVDARYDLFPIEDVSYLPGLIAATEGLCGLNVTIPHKEAVLPYLDEVDPVAKSIGAVNCINIIKGRTRGFNTDVIGFEKSLQPLLEAHHKHALVLGTGGAAKAVVYVLGKLGIHTLVVSREPSGGEISYDDVTPELMGSNKLVINTTPLGMFPDETSFPVLPYTAISDKHLLYDLIYNPAVTRFLALGREHGAKIKNGLEMLELQAEASWEIWNTIS